MPKLPNLALFGQTDDQLFESSPAAAELDMITPIQQTKKTRYTAFSPLKI